MSLGALTVLTYLLHYLLARLIYDHLLRPLLDGHASDALLLVCVGIAAFALGRLTRRRI